MIEVANTFSKVAQRPLAKLVIENALRYVNQGSAKVVHVDEALWQRGWQLFLNRLDKDWSLTDCISFAVMSDMSITDAFTSDKHFEQAGFIRLMQSA